MTKHYFKATVYEKITESFDTTFSIDAPDDISDEDLNQLVAEKIERIRVEGDDERRFLSVDDTDYEIEEIDSEGAEA